MKQLSRNISGLGSSSILAKLGSSSALAKPVATGEVSTTSPTQPSQV